MPTEEPPPSRQAAFGAELFAFEDPLAGRIEQLTLHAENHREAAADLLRAADRAEARARRLSAYRYTIDAIAGDPQAHTWSAGSSRTGAGDGEQLVTRGPRNPAPWTTDDRSAGGRRPGGTPLTRSFAQGSRRSCCAPRGRGRARPGRPSLVVRRGHRRCAQGCCAGPAAPSCDG
jgi:hypothetical protein